MTIKIFAGTKIYLKKKHPFKLYIKPNKNLFNDTLLVAYDVKHEDKIIIPQNTLVIGNWITETHPTIAAQFQINYLCLNDEKIPIVADSDLYEAISAYNQCEIHSAPYLYKIMDFKSPSNLVRRIVKANCQIKVLFDDNLNSLYIEIPTREIQTTLIEDLCI